MLLEHIEGIYLSLTMWDLENISEVISEEKENLPRNEIWGRGQDRQKSVCDLEDSEWFSLQLARQLVTDTAGEINLSQVTKGFVCHAEEFGIIKH